MKKTITHDLKDTMMKIATLNHKISATELESTSTNSRSSNPTSSNLQINKIVYSSKKRIIICLLDRIQAMTLRVSATNNTIMKNRKTLNKMIS